MPVAIPVKAILAQANPLKDNPWSARAKVSEARIKLAIDEGRFQPVPLLKNLSRRYHEERIAYLANHGWSEPIDIDVGVPGLSSPDNWIVEDGNHRLSAAAYRKDKWIACAVSGCLRQAQDWLEVDVEEPELLYSPEVLVAMGYEAWRVLPDGELAAVGRMNFGNGRLYAGINATGYENCWCFDSYEKAWHALWNWDLASMLEPAGWKRHPFTGRRRENGDPATEYIAR